MTDGQKQRIENIHTQIEDVMVRKARLTVMAREAILKGNRPDDSLLHELHSIDGYITGLYHQEIDEIKKFGKKLKGTYMGNDLIRSEVAKRLYRDDAMIDKGDLELYNTLLQELYQVQEEQTALYFYINRDGKRRTTNNELERNLRASIVSMQSVMPTLKNIIESESERIQNAIDSNVTKHDYIDINVQERSARHGSQRNKILSEEKRELRQIETETQELETARGIANTTYDGASKTKNQMNMEVHERRKEIQAQREAEEARIKEARRIANEERRLENEEKKQSNQSAGPVQEEKELEAPTEQPIKKVEKPKNKFNLKKRVKQAIAAVLAAVALYTGLTFLKPKQPVQNVTSTEPTIVDVVETIPSQQPIEEIVSNIPSGDAEQEEVQEQVARLGDIVTIGDNIYNDIYSAANKENAQKPYYDDTKEYTIAKITLTNGTDTKTIYANKEGKELYDILSQQGYTAVVYGITIRTSDEIEVMSPEQIDANITGYENQEGIKLGDTVQKGRGM